ncbi:hypothetical protein [Piscinibacter sakaiensis]|uniref:hypothetical protein n=1 Tax=Piscinibacter sakaiensis TaxID=1547922 RepID=UPI003AAB83A8
MHPDICPRQREPRPVHTVFFAAALLACGSAQAQADPNTFIGASQAFTYQSNIFRTPDGQPASSDTISSTGIVAGTDIALGRQRLHANANVRSNNFRDQDQLDNVSYGLTTGLDWQTLHRLSGSLSYAANRNLASYASDINLPRLNSKNIEESRQFDATARIGGTTRLSFEAGYQHRERRYSAPQFDPQELKQSAVKVGARYRPSAALTVGAGLRFTEGRFPLYRQGPGGIYVADKFQRRDVDLSATWTPSGRSALNARVSIGRQTHSEARQNEFSGVTGALAWTYQATGKLQVVTTLTRDTGAESQFFDAGNGIVGEYGTSRLATGVQVAARYDATAKTRLQASVAHTHRSLNADISNPAVGATASQSGSDSTTKVSLGARYVPTRNVAVDCGVAKEKRSTSTTLSYDYSAESANCAVQVQLDVR